MVVLILSISRQHFHKEVETDGTGKKCVRLWKINGTH